MSDFLKFLFSAVPTVQCHAAGVVVTCPGEMQSPNSRARARLRREQHASNQLARHDRGIKILQHRSLAIHTTDRGMKNYSVPWMY